MIHGRRTSLVTHRTNTSYMVRRRSNSHATTPPRSSAHIDARLPATRCHHVTHRAATLPSWQAPARRGLTYSAIDARPGTEIRREVPGARAHRGRRHGGAVQGARHRPARLREAGRDQEDP